MDWRIAAPQINLGHRQTSKPANPCPWRWPPAVKQRRAGRLRPPVRAHRHHALASSPRLTSYVKFNPRRYLRGSRREPMRLDDASVSSFHRNNGAGRPECWRQIGSTVAISRENSLQTRRTLPILAPGCNPKKFCRPCEIGTLSKPTSSVLIPCVPQRPNEGGKNALWEVYDGRIKLWHLRRGPSSTRC